MSYTPALICDVWIDHLDYDFVKSYNPNRWEYSRFWCIMNLKMFQKIKNYYKSPIWQQIRDVRFLGFMVFGVLVLLTSWSSVKVIETNFVLQKQVARQDEQNKVQELINSNLKLSNEYYNTDTYLELTARKQFGKGAPGEKLLLVPKSVALTYAKELPITSVEQKPNPSSKKPLYRQNLDAWLNFFLHRS